MVYNNLTKPPKKFRSQILQTKSAWLELGTGFPIKICLWLKYINVNLWAKSWMNKFGSVQVTAAAAAQVPLLVVLTATVNQIFEQKVEWIYLVLFSNKMHATMVLTK